MGSILWADYFWIEGRLADGVGYAGLGTEHGISVIGVRCGHGDQRDGQLLVFDFVADKSSLLCFVFLLSRKGSGERELLVRLSHESLNCRS